MSDTLRLRAYNVLFGDAFLLTIPDRDKKGKTRTRHLLIDIGNAWQDKSGGSLDAVFEPVVRDIQQELDGGEIDLYISTHEHMDHVQGLRYVSRHTDPPLDLPLARSWLTASAAPDYYDRHPGSEMKLAAQMVSTIQEYGRALAAAGEELPQHTRLLLDINDPGETDKCVLYIIEHSRRKYFLHRGSALGRRHNFKEARFDIWAPEEDTSVYYKAVSHIAAAVEAGGEEVPPALRRIPPPPGVDASAFNNLLRRRNSGVLDTLLNIDKAANNTSLVFTLEWRGWTLLFSGDAEQRSWEMMEAQGKLGAVDFIKVSHHGSGTGTPPERILRQLFPEGGEKERLGLVSTHPGTYGGVPADEALQRYTDLGVGLVDIRDHCAPGGHVDILFAEGARQAEVVGEG